MFPFFRKTPKNPPPPPLAPVPEFVVDDRLLRTPKPKPAPEPERDWREWVNPEYNNLRGSVATGGSLIGGDPVVVHRHTSDTDDGSDFEEQLLDFIGIPKTTRALSAQGRRGSTYQQFCRELERSNPDPNPKTVTHPFEKRR
jgi:hypothetical protein